MKGQLVYSDDVFPEVDPEIQAMFYDGRSDEETTVARKDAEEDTWLGIVEARAQ
jgi:hypothetical protein